MHPTITSRRIARPAPRSARRSVGLIIALVWLGVGLGRSSAAEFLDADMRFILDVVPGETISYRVPIDIERAGQLRIDADWPERRVLSFRLEPPAGTMPVVRRSGPPPQTLTVEVGAGATGRWILSVHGLAARGGGSGRLGIRLPRTADAAVPDQGRPEASAEHSGPVFLEPESVPVPWQPLVRSASEFAGLVAERPRADACRWQESFVDWTASWGKRLADGGRPPPDGTRRTLQRIADVIRDVDALLDPTDPALVDPPAQDPAKLAAWLQRRSLRLESVQDDLDEVAAALERGHAPDLQLHAWPSRLVACVMACERHFEERARVGTARAVNGEIAAAQWDRLLLAAEILDHMATLPELR